MSPAAPLRVIELPYHHGRERAGIGRGPGRFVERGVAERLAANGHAVETERVVRDGPFGHEVGATMAVDAALADRVRASLDRGETPFVFAGDCNSSLGTLAGLRRDAAAPAPGVVWFDAHGDFNTPETSASGFFDGMALATATGECWPALVRQLTGFEPVPPANVVLAGIRDLDPGETDLLAASAVTLVDAAELSGDDPGEVFEAALERLATRTPAVYLHVDLDVLDTAIAPANEFAPPGGLAVDRMTDAIRAVGERFDVRAAAFTAYDPACDPDDRLLEAGLRLAEAVGDALDG